MSSNRPDIVLFCHHHLTGSQHEELHGRAPGPGCDHCRVVKRFRWSTAQGVWTVNGKTVMTQDHRLRCGSCTWDTPTPGGWLNNVLLQMTTTGARSFSMEDLDRTMRNTRPEWRRTVRRQRFY